MDKETRTNTTGRTGTARKKASSLVGRKRATPPNAAVARKEHEEAIERRKNEKEARESKNVEEIIESGTPEERAALVISSFDRSKQDGAKGKGILSAADMSRLQANINKRPQEERDTFLFYAKEYDRLVKFHQRLHIYIKEYQMNVGLLATLIAKWEAYDREAEVCDKLHRSLVDGQSSETSDGTAAFYVRNILEAHEGWGEATLLYDEASNTFKADIDGEGQLYSLVADQAKETATALSKLKAVIEVAEAHVSKVACFVEPMRMENSIEMVRDELFARCYGGPLKYFRSELNRRREEGESITQEDEKRAVYPDYYEVEPDGNVTKFSSEHLYSLM